MSVQSIFNFFDWYEFRLVLVVNVPELFDNDILAILSFLAIQSIICLL